MTDTHWKIASKCSDDIYLNIEKRLESVVLALISTTGLFLTQELSILVCSILLLIVANLFSVSATGISVENFTVHFLFTFLPTVLVGCYIETVTIVEIVE